MMSRNKTLFSAGKGRFPVIILVFTLIFIALALAECSFGSGSSSSTSLDTDENRALLAESGLIENLEDSTQQEIIEAPWIAVEHVQDEDEGELWRIVGSSESELSDDSLAAMRFIAVVNWNSRSATYKSSTGRTSTGTSEYVDIVYYDAGTGVKCGSETIWGKKLPKTTTSTPRYTIDDRDVVDTIDARVEYGYSASYSPEKFTVKDGVLTGVNTDELNEQPAVVIPEGVTEISADALADLAKYRRLNHMRLPKSLVAIGAPLGNITDKTLVLSVYEGSYAHQYAKDNHIVYGLWGTLDAYVPDGSVEIDKVSYNYTNMKEYKRLHVPASVSYIRAGNGGIGGAIDGDLTLVVEANSYAEQFAQENGFTYEIE